MQIAREDVLNRIKQGWKVLDIGSWFDVCPRADVIIDASPYETRRNHFPDEKEYFSKETWIQGDVCSNQVWDQLQDNEFDFVICSHLLEDIRDPLFVCRQLNRVAKRGYVECPSRFRECSRGSKDATFAGYDHHRWILDIIDNDLVFTPKLHWANHIDYLTEQRRKSLLDYPFHFTGVFWEEAFNYYERTHKGEKLESMNLLHFFDNYDYVNGQFIYDLGQSGSQIKPGSLVWNDEYQLPIEKEDPLIIKKYEDRYQYIRSETTISKRNL